MLEIIRDEYYWTMQNLKGVKRNIQLARLMTDLEHYFGCMKINPTPEELEQPEVKLYQKISKSRQIR